MLLFISIDIVAIHMNCSTGTPG